MGAAGRRRKRGCPPSAAAEHTSCREKRTKIAATAARGGSSFFSPVKIDSLCRRKRLRSARSSTPRTPTLRARRAPARVLISSSFEVPCLLGDRRQRNYVIEKLRERSLPHPRSNPAFSRANTHGADMLVRGPSLLIRRAERNLHRRVSPRHGRNGNGDLLKRIAHNSSSSVQIKEAGFAASQ
jgi:hypothetical protein